MLNEFIRTGRLNVPEIGQNGKPARKEAVIERPDNLIIIATSSGSAFPSSRKAGATSP